MNLDAFPPEIFDLIIEHLVLTIGIQKAVLLRVTNRAFDAAIEQATCVAQVIAPDSASTPDLLYRIAPRLRGKIIEVQSRSGTAGGYVKVVAAINCFLDSHTGPTTPELLRLRHEAIAEAVLPVGSTSCDANIGTRDLLCGAATIGSLKIVKMLLETNGTSADLNDVQGATQYFPSPLTLASARGHYDIVQQLLDTGARPEADMGAWCFKDELSTQSDWNTTDDYHRYATLRDSPSSALSSAVLGGHTEVVHLLLQTRFRPPRNSLEYLRGAWAGAKAGRQDLIQLLLDVIDKWVWDFTGLGKLLYLAAARYDRRDVIAWYLSIGGDINALRDMRADAPPGALHIASALGNLSLVRLLLDMGADVNLSASHHVSSNGEVSPVDCAASCGQEEIVELLIRHGADPTKAARSAINGGQPRVLSLLLRAFPTLISQQEFDMQCMLLRDAMACGNLTLLTLLVNAGVPLNEGLFGTLEHLPLNLAKEYYGEWITQHLLSLGAQETAVQQSHILSSRYTRRVLISQGTWEWVGKY